MIRGVVYDCMLFLQAAANLHGPAGQCFQHAHDQHVVLYVSDHGLAEFKRIVLYPRTQKKFAHLTPTRVDEFLEWVGKFAVKMDIIPTVFEIPRDPKDSHYVNLAIAAHAQLVVSRDLDLLHLMTGDDTPAIDFRIRFPHLQITDPVTFLRSFPEPISPH